MDKCPICGREEQLYSGVDKIMCDEKKELGLDGA